MKLIKIKTTKGVDNVSIANVSSWVTSGGNYDYNTHIYKTTEGKYGFLAVCPLIEQQTQLEGDYVRYLKINGSERITEYVSKAFKKDAYEIGRKVIIDSLNELYNTDTTDYSYSYVLTTRIGLSQLPDTFTSTDEEQEPAIVSTENSTYTTASDYRSLFATATGSIYAKTSAAPGMSMVAFYDYNVGSPVYDTVETALVAAEEAGMAMASKQCAAFRDKHFDPEASAAEGAKLEEALNDADEAQQEALSNFEEAQATLADAQEALQQAQQDLEDVKTANAEGKEQCLNGYNECLSKPGEDPAACLASYNSCLQSVDAEFNIPEAEDNVAARQEGVTQAQQQVSVAQQELNAAEQALSEANEALDAYKEAKDRIESLCGGPDEERRSSGPVIPPSAFNIDGTGGIEEMFKAYIKYQSDGASFADDIADSINDVLGYDGPVSILDTGDAKYGVIGNQVLNQQEAEVTAKIIKSISSSAMS